MRLRRGNAFKGDGEHEVVARLRIDRRAQDGADSSGAHRYGLFAKRIKKLDVRCRQIHLFVSHSSKPRLEMFLQHLQRIARHARDGHDRLRAVHVTDRAEGRKHGARNRQRSRKQKLNDFQIRLGQHFASRSSRRKLALGHDFARRLDRSHCRRGQVVALIDHHHRSRFLHWLGQRSRSEIEQIARGEQLNEFIRNFPRRREIGVAERLLARFVAHVDESEKPSARQNGNGEQPVSALTKENLGQTHVRAEAVDEKRTALHRQTIDEIVGRVDQFSGCVIERIARDQFELFLVQIVARGKVERGLRRLHVLDATIEDLLELRLERFHVVHHGRK